MKKLTLKVRLSLWFTLILTLISLLLLGVVSSVSSAYERKALEEELIETVQDQKSRDTESYLDDLEKGKIRESSFLKKNIKLMVFSEEGVQLAGLYEDTDFSALPYSEGKKPSTVTVDGETYLYFDQWVKVRGGEDYWVRGVASVEEPVLSVFSRYPYLLLLLPLLIGLAFAGGYFLTGCFLKPVREIGRTADAIRESGDLSTRIPTSNQQDELSALAGTLNQMFDTLQTNFEADKRFASNASHELRTPVSVILAQCEYAFDHVSDPQELLDVIAAVQKQGYKMSNLIETLLLFTRMEQHTEKYPMERTDISELLLSSCEDFQLIADRGIQVETDIVPGVEANVNRELFTLMANNLIQNAIRYGRDGGHVWVSLALQEGASKSNAHSDSDKRHSDSDKGHSGSDKGHSGSDKGPAVCLQVKDDGMGIAAEDLPHIFDLFYRSDSSRSSKGLGLGLPLVKKIAEYHGGRINCRSEKEKGSIFTVTLPNTGDGSLCSAG
ncbi:MAG: HAMP domain-containing histidine kinase [Firmicutes bacterium]|nr:HAMP domain-containing histidine kinase [Bacillota bacterium]